MLATTNNAAVPTITSGSEPHISFKFYYNKEMKDAQLPNVSGSFKIESYPSFDANLADANKNLGNQSLQLFTKNDNLYM